MKSKGIEELLNKMLINNATISCIKAKQKILSKFQFQAERIKELETKVKILKKMVDESTNT